MYVDIVFDINYNINVKGTTDKRLCPGFMKQK